MSWALFAGNVGAGINTAIKTGQQMADRNFELEGRDEVRDERARAKAKRQEDEDYKKELIAIYGGADDAPQAAPASKAAAPDAPAPAADLPAGPPPPDAAGAGEPSSTSPAASIAPLARAVAPALGGSPAAPAIKRSAGMRDPQVWSSAARLALKHGKIDEFKAYSDHADKISWAQSTDAVRQLEASMGSMTPLEVATKAGEIFASDIGAGRIANIAQNKDGSISFDSINTSNGQVFRRTAKTTDDVLMQLKSFYTPENYEAIRAERVKAEIERAKDQAKTVTLKTGDQVYQNGKLVMENTNGFVQDGVNPDGSPRHVRSSGTGSGGGGSGRQEKVPPTTIQQINDAIFASSEKADGAMKFSPAQMTQAQAAGAYLAGRNPGMNPEAIASTAVQLMQNPAAGTPRLGIGGDVVRVLKDATTGQEVSVADFPIDPNSKAGKATLEVLKQQVPQVIDGIERSIPKSEGLVNLAAHGDTAARDKLSALLLQQAIVDVDAHPRAKGMSADQRYQLAQQVVKQEKLPALNRQMQAIRAYGEPPPSARPPPNAGSRNASAGQSTRGIFADTQGRTNLLEPFSRAASGLNDWRQGMADETNANEEASGIPRRPQ